VASQGTVRNEMSNERSGKGLGAAATSGHRGSRNFERLSQVQRGYVDRLQEPFFVWWRGYLGKKVTRPIRQERRPSEWLK